VGVSRKESDRGGDMKKVVLLLLFFIPLVYCQHTLPEKDFFVKEYEPQAIIVVGDSASADDVIAATVVATKLADLTAQKEVEVTEIVSSETEHSVAHMVPFVQGDYHLLFDLDDDKLLMYNYQLERLKDTIPGGFIPTWGRTWASETTQLNLLGDYYSMLEIRQYIGYSWWYLFYGVPRNYEHQYIKNGQSKTYGNYTVTLLEVDIDEMEAKIMVRTDEKEDLIFLPVYCKDCKHVVGELFCNATDPLPALDAADAIQKEYFPFFINLKYFVKGPLSNADAVARANEYWNPPPVPGTPDMFIDGEFHIPSTSPDYFMDYLGAFYTSVGVKIPLRVYTTGFISENTGQVNVFLSADYYLDNVVMHAVLIEKEVTVGGVVYRHVVRDVLDPVYLSMAAQSTVEYSYTFSVPPAVTDPEHNLGVVVFVQDILTKRIYQADVLDLGEKRFVYEVDVDADFDGRADEVEFAIECTKIPFLGVQGNAWARFNVYTLTDYGVLFPMCCDTPFFEDDVAKWDLEIFKRGDLGYVLVKVCNPFDIRCLEPGDLIYGPRHLTRIEIVDSTNTHVTFKFQYMKIIETEVEGERSIEPTSLVWLASEVTEKELYQYNVILIGGPDVNPFTKKIVETEKSTIDWSVSKGEWEFIKDPFGYGKDGLIVAGKDRSGTKSAANNLRFNMEMLENQ
jgi:hypothetical protein